MYLFWGRDLAITCTRTKGPVRDGSMNISALSNVAVHHVLIAEVAQHNYKEYTTINYANIVQKNAAKRCM